MLDKKNANTKKNEDEKNVQEETPKTSNDGNTPAADELSKIKSDVNKLSNDLQTTVTELKKSIVDIRSAVSEIENPFNLLRTISSEKDLKNITEERLPPGVKSIILEKPQENYEAADEIREEAKAEQTEPQTHPEPLAQTQLKIKNSEEKHEEAEQKPSKISAAYLDWIWTLLESGLQASEIHQLACSCEYMGYLPAHANEIIYSLAIVAEKLREKGFTKAHLLLNMYKAATISKVGINQQDMVTLIAITEKQLKKIKPTKGA
ncbi:MAG: hypothetical protein QXL10_02560 [Candidatus Bathyarchaeia archaeon]